MSAVLWDREVKDAADEWRYLATLGGPFGALRSWAANQRRLREAEAKLTYSRHRSTSPTRRARVNPLCLPAARSALALLALVIATAATTSDESVWMFRVQAPSPSSWPESPPPPNPVWDPKLRAVRHHELQDEIGAANRALAEAERRRLRRRASRSAERAPSTAARRAHAAEATAARRRGELLRKGVLVEGFLTEKEVKGRGTEAAIRERAAEMHEQWRELDDRSWEGVATGWMVRPRLHFAQAH